MHPHPICIVVANEQASRFFLRAKPKAPLRELAEFADSSDFLDHEDARPSEFRRSGSRTMLKARSRKSEEQLQVFLRRVAGQIDLAVSRHEAEGLAICASPHVLGLLRDFIAEDTRVRLVYELPADKVRKSASALDEEMRSLQL